MRLLITAFGSRGDVQPLVALARVLQSRGHSAQTFMPPNFVPWARGLGLEAMPAGTDFERFVDDYGERIFTSVPAVRREVRAQVEAILPQAGPFDACISTTMCVAGAMFAEKHGIPYRFVMFSPSALASAEYPSLLTPWQNLPKLLNRLTWRLENKIWDAAFLGTFNQLRRKHGLPNASGVWAELIGKDCIVASEPLIAQAGPDATAHVQTGAWFFDDPMEVSREVEEFLQAGTPPVFIGFGSMTDSKPAETMERLLGAVRLAGVRAIISRGWAKLDASDLPPDVLLVGPAPHAKIFPRCAAVVHHGGAGTLHQTARAGVPHIPVPHLIDQYFWSTRLERLGLTPGRQKRSEIDPRQFAQAMRQCVEDTAMRERCRKLAAGMRLDGLERTVALIEGLARGGRGNPRS